MRCTKDERALAPRAHVQSRSRDSLAGNVRQYFNAWRVRHCRVSGNDFRFQRRPCAAIVPHVRTFPCKSRPPPRAAQRDLPRREVVARAAVRYPTLSAVLLGGMGGITKELQDRLAGLIKLRTIGAR